MQMQNKRSLLILAGDVLSDDDSKYSLSVFCCCKALQTSKSDKEQSAEYLGDLGGPVVGGPGLWYARCRRDSSAGRSTDVMKLSVKQKMREDAFHSINILFLHESGISRHSAGSRLAHSPR